MFRFGCMKWSSVLSLCSVVAVSVIAGFFASCDNPFTSGMGERPVWERPTISNVSPVSNDLLTGEVTFRGEAWAHRELRRIDVRIGRYTTEDRTEDGRVFGHAGNPILDWMDIGRLGGHISRGDRDGGVGGSWEFTLDTLALPEAALKAALDDGFVRIRFRVFDNTQDPALSQEFVYNVKNLPSQVTMALPSDELIRDPSVIEPLRIAGDAYIQGRVTDLRGLAPGYPMIQIWPAFRADITANPDGFVNDSHFGLASMFLTTIVPVESVRDDIRYMTGRYASRDGMTVNVANFQFRLDSFTIEAARNDGVRAAVFGNEFMIGEHFFRIITRDTEGIVGHFPPYGHGTDQEDRSSPGDPVLINIIGDATPPVIEIDNRDRSGEQLAARPNIYVITGINERIIALDDPDAPGRPVFRLRTLATHGDGIARAELHWEHRATNRQGQLTGYLEEQSGTPDRAEVNFVFTADGRHRGIFTTHPTPYLLTLRVMSRVGSWGERSFSLIMDGEAPRVEIRPSIRGAVAPPAGNRLPMHGGFINDNHITVNGNIQVSVDRTSSPPIMFDDSGQRVKWFVGPHFDPANPPQDSILYRLIAFQRGPSRDNLAFFFDDFDGSGGRVDMPIATGPVYHDAYRTHNFKYDTSEYDGQDLWLYVVAMNQVYNLGFAMQRIRVDQNTDFPEIETPGLFQMGTPGDLEVTVTGGDPTAPDFDGNYPRRNVLTGGQGISIRVSDDDGIVRNAEYIRITLTEFLDGGPTDGDELVDGRWRRSRTLTTEQLEFLQGSRTAWSGTLEQSLIAQVLDHVDDDGRYRLPDGVYRLSIEVSDSAAYKVMIDGEPGQQRSAGESLWFAVHNEIPDVMVTEPANNSLLSEYGVDIRGTVRSPFRLGSLWITFDPAITGSDSYDMLTDESYVDIGGTDYRRFSVTVPSERGADGLYTYSWHVRDVRFTRPGDTGPERREFTVRAFDALGFVNTALPNWVRVDVEPPTVHFTGFNQGRPLGSGGDVFEIWGNVHFAVNVTDRHGLGSQPLPPGVTLANESLSNVKWWLLRHDADPPEWNTPFPSGVDGTGGRFLYRGTLSATFEAVFDSTTLADGAEYKLYVIARDAAGNESDPERLDERGIYRIRVNQYADLPELARPAPADGVFIRPDAAGNLRITGLARDTDGFDPGRVGGIAAGTTVPENSHVEILFYDDGWNPDGWIPVPGLLDGTGAIDFAFDVVTAFSAHPHTLSFNPLIPQAIRDRGDGLIRYRVRISDEPASLAGRTRSKNPQIDLDGNRVYTFLTGNPDNQLPNVPTRPALVLVFPVETEYFSLTLDTIAPVFTLPEPPHLFRDIAGLREVLYGGTVTEENLLSFDVTFGPYVRRLLGDPPGGPTHDWDWDVHGEDLERWFYAIPEGMHTITFVAEDRAGNRSPSINWDFTKDTVAPVVNFTGFNQGRPLGEGGDEFEVWGNVHFAVNVTDAHGLGSEPLPFAAVGMGNERLSNVKWWLLRYDAESPVWGYVLNSDGDYVYNEPTPFPSGADGTGGRFFFRGNLSAAFEAVFDSRILDNNAVYKLYVIAMDAAGNTTAPQRLDERGIGAIRVNQYADRPELDRMVPMADRVLRPDATGRLRITGVARDTDGFNPARVGTNTPADSHVEILFYDGGWDPSGWIPVPGFLDGTGAIDFAFDVVTAFNPITGAVTFNQNIPAVIRDRGDGEIYFQIRVSDESAAIDGRARSKNPQLDSNGNRIHTFFTGNLDNPLSYIPFMAAETMYADPRSFTLDTVAPVINFKDGTSERMFWRVEDLMNALPGGSVFEENLRFFTVTFDGETFTLLDGSSDELAWDWDSICIQDGNSIGDHLEYWFYRDWQGSRTITFVAEDQAGNRSPPINWDFTKDTVNPDVRFIGFNQGRPVNRIDMPTGGHEYRFEVWGNVHFAVNVTDLHGLGVSGLPPGVTILETLPPGVIMQTNEDHDPIEGRPMLAEVRWWLLRHDAASPVWGYVRVSHGVYVYNEPTPFPSGYGGTGGQFFAQDGATFQAVFDSRTLEEGVDYKLYVIARDVAGNVTVQRMDERDIDLIRVNQAADYPYLDRLSPGYGTVLRPDAAGNLRITGLARDADGFNPATLPNSDVLVNSHVEILFYDDGWNPNGWIPVTGRLDGTGAIDFAFDVVTAFTADPRALTFNPLIPQAIRDRGDGEIRYRISVSDDHTTVVNRMRNKNPQDIVGYTFFTGNPNSPLPNVPAMSAAVSVFTPDQAEYFSLILDTTVPRIDLADGVDGRAFVNAADLRAALPGGTVVDENLSFLDVTFGGGTPFRLLSNPAGSTHSWNWGDTPGTIGTALDAWFTNAADGRHTITFVAEDMAGNRSPPLNWDFTKDTVAPVVNFTGFNQGRPVRSLDPTGELVFEVWGNVHFAVNVTDLHGLGSTSTRYAMGLDEDDDLPPNVVDTLAEVRWWLLPYNAAIPSWNTAFPSGHNGTGGQFFAQEDATFQAVFDSRTLAGGAFYKLYVIARDEAGNESSPERLGGVADNAINRIRVDQSADRPEFDRLVPGDGIVLRPDAAGNLRITGLARDTDGFNPPATLSDSDVLVSSPVGIQFHDGAEWGEWIPVPGGLDGTGAIDFYFYVVRNRLRAQGVPGAGNDEDGKIRYRIMVSDEHLAIDGRTRSKNPQIAVGYTFFTGDSANPLPIVPMMDASVMVFPNETDYFSLILDTTPPVIGTLPQQPPHLFRNVYDLLAVFGSGTVNDANLRFLDVTFGGNTYRLLSYPSGNSHTWDWYTSVEGSDPPNSVEDRLSAWLDGAEDGRHTITFVAEDRAGNRSPSINWDFTKDSEGPTVRFTGFNQGRPVRPYDPDYPEDELVFEVWGNVHFAVNVADLHGIGSSAIPSGVAMPSGMENERLAEIRWWLLPYNVASPTWNTEFPSGPARGIGGQFFAQDGAVFEAVFDSTILEDEGYYILHIIARDVAGNETRTYLGDGDPISRIRVNQDADLPELDRLAPRNEGDIIAFPRLDAAGNLRITGLARDTDGFDPHRVGGSANPPVAPPANSHVQILFYDNGWDEDYGWIPVTGRLDGAGAIDFYFYVVRDGERTDDVPGAGDGEILYRIRVSDEDGAVEGRTRNKNPQYGSSGDIIGRFFTGDPDDPVSSVPLVVSASHMLESGFILDMTPPVISIHYNQNMFQNIGYLVNAISGTVAEVNLSFLDVTFGPNTRRLLHPSTGPHNWDFDGIRGDLESWFVDADEGRHTISFVAEDRAGNRSAPTSWSFTKDTEGPTLTLLGGMRRSILHNDQIDDASAPGGRRFIVESDFPDNWPHDWPHGNSWRTHADWTPEFRAAITATDDRHGWPSDFRSIGAMDGHDDRVAAVLERIRTEREQTPFVFRDRDADGVGAIAVRFDDRLSYVWHTDPAETRIEYRFTIRGELDTDTAHDDGWRESPSLTRGVDDPANRLTWNIPLRDIDNRVLDDGEHSVDIRFSDVAGNQTEVRGIRFFVDTDAPFFYMGDAVSSQANRNDPERFRVRLAGMPDATPDLQFGNRHAWVFRATTATPPSAAMAFQVRGMIHDANLSQLDITIGGGGSAPIEARAYTDDPLNPASRLRLTPLALGSDYWLWELDVLETDVATLRGTGSDVGGNISLVATDVANRRTTVQWPFYLDSTVPDINFNLERVVVPGTVAEGQPVPNVPANIEFRGSVEDTTGITGLMFILARRDYEAGAWHWFDGTDFNAASAAGGLWTDVPRTRGTDTLWRAGDTFVSWTVNAAELAAAGYTLTAEGQYRIDVWARDGSLAWDVANANENAGNPIDTVARTNDALAGDIPGDIDGGRFFIDRGAPVIMQGQAERRFFNTNPGTANLWFDFTVRDYNTVPRGQFRAEIRNMAGDVLLSYPAASTEPPSDSATRIIVDWFGNNNLIAYDGPSTTDGYRPITADDFPANWPSDWPNGTTTNGAITHNWHSWPLAFRNAIETWPSDFRSISSAAVIGRINDSRQDWYTGYRNVRLRPEGLVSGQYTLVLTVRDAAGNQTNVNHTRTFTIGNEVPRPVVDTPVLSVSEDDGQYVTLPYSNIALAGPVTIRGRAIAGDGTGGIETVQYLLLPVGVGPTGAPPELDAGAAAWAAWNAQFASLTGWRSGAWDYSFDTVPTPTNRQLMRMEDNPGLSWTINIDNTRNIVQSSFADTLAPVNNSADIFWRGVPIARTGANPPDTRRMRLAIRSEDAAGNVGFTTRDIWLFPEGDRPWVDIWTPESTDPNQNLLSGPFTIRGMAGDNERVQDVFFRVLRNNAPILMSVPAFLDERADGTHDPTYGAVGHPQLPRTFDGHTGWYRANSTRTWETDWSALINSYGELEPDERGRGDRITIEVIAVDAARLSNIDGELAWDFATPMIGEAARGAYVVSGAPFVTDEEIRLSTGTDAWTDWSSPTVAHMGGGRATFRFTVRHEVGIEAIRYREVMRVNTAPANQPAQWVLQPTGVEIPLLKRVNTAESGQPENWVIRPIAVSEADITARLVSHGFSVRAGELRSIPIPGTPARSYVAHDVYVEVDTQSPAFTNLMGAGSSFWLPLHISTADISYPIPNEGRPIVRLPIDNSPPHARNELNVWPASLATMGGSARAGAAGETGVPGGVDRVVVWFQRAGSAVGVSWYDWREEFRWGDEINVPNGSIRLPLIPARADEDGGNYAIVIDRNNPFGVLPPQWGNASPGDTASVATGWIPGGQGQLWNFTIDTNRLPSGHLDMHFVAFDRAGNAFHDVQRITVMNNAPLIAGIQLATDILGVDDSFETALELDGEIGVTRQNIFSTIRDTFDPAPDLTDDDRERDIRRGIAPLEANPTTHMRSHDVRGTRHHVDNFTVRNEFLALSVTTIQYPHESADRTFRVEYVSSARLLTGTALRARLASRPGGVFVIQNAPDGISWEPVGANRATVSTGYAFLAATEIPSDWAGAGATIANVSAWELNYLDERDPYYPPDLQLDLELDRGAANADLTRAEFAFGSEAFGTGGWNTIGEVRTTGDAIVDHDPNATNLHERYSLFIVKVFDGDLEDMFADFTLLSIRVNNNDRTAPFAQLHDLNPLAENLGRGDRVTDAPPAGLAPAGIYNTGINQNRLRGGLWRDDRLGNLSRPGNIEPRFIDSSSPLYVANRHSLTPAQMGGAAGTAAGQINSAAFFERDTVSGRVVLRGYAEDDQRVREIVLDIGGTRVPILTGRTPSAAPNPGATTGSAGLLQRAAGRNDVFFFDSIDLFRHRVEWAFVWDTAAIPANTVVGDITVRAIAYNANTDTTAATLGIRQSGLMTWENRAGSMETRTDRYNPNVRNPGFPTNVYRYNSIVMNVRPYITGFRRNAALFFNNTRSMQGRYPFSRGETVVVTGFNLGRDGGTPALTTAITLPNSIAATGVGAVSATQRDNFNLTSVDAARYQRFDIPATAGTGDGIVRLTVGDAANPAVNTSDNPRIGGVRHVQPWNIERSNAVEGSDLWDNRTSVHIWSSADDTTHRFPRDANTILFGTDMSIDPRTGMLHSSHNSGTAHAATNQSRTYRGTLGGSAQIIATQFIDPIIQSSIFVSVDPNDATQPWVVSSIIGRQSNSQVGAQVGSIFLAGPGGLTASGMAAYGGTSGFLIESIWHNASTDSPDSATPSPSEQFRSPRVVTFHDGTDEHIHVVYWDSHASAIKYRYNRRSQAIGTTNAVRQPWGLGTGAAGMNTAFDQTDENAASFVRRLWTNLDGGFDMDDMRPAGAAVTGQGTGARVWFDATFAATVAAQGSRVVGFPRGVPAADIPANNNTGGTPLRGTAIETGELSDIAVSSHGHPVVVYFDATNERLRMAVSNNRTPVAAAGWRIIPDVTVGDIRGQGAGRYVSMRIDTVRRYATGAATDNTDTATGNWNTVHISTFNANTNSLVYIRGRVNTNFGNSTTQAEFWQFHHALVVDTLGTVGRRSTISLDADGNPWIAYYDQANVGSMDGVKVAFFNPAFTREHRDVYGNSLRGWEVMHVPAAFRVSEGVDRGLRSSRIGIENFPTRNFPSNRVADGRAGFYWRAAVGFLSGDNQFRVAYWMP